MDNYITEEKKKFLTERLEYLKTTKRKKILETLEFAKSLGDLSENAEYHQAREEQGKLEEEISKIEHTLQSSVIATKQQGDAVQIGSSVSVEKEGTAERKTYVIVGSEESDMKQGKISNRSPLGEALFGKKKGDTVNFKTPQGSLNYKIISVE